MTWPEAILWIAVGTLLRSSGRMLRVLFGSQENRLDIHQERRQMWTKDGIL